jgi:hypothetical protein
MFTSSHLFFLVVALLCSYQCSAADMSKYYKRTGAKYLKSKAEEPNVIALESGMLVEILKESSSDTAKSPTASGTRQDMQQRHHVLSFGPFPYLLWFCNAFNASLLM